MAKAGKSPDFEKDIVFLFFLIDRKVAEYVKLIIGPRSRNQVNVMMVNDNQLEEYVKEISEYVLSVLSESYERALMSYFNQAGLREFIIENIYTRIIEAGITINADKVRSRNMASLQKVVEGDDNN